MHDICRNSVRAVALLCLTWVCGAWQEARAGQAEKVRIAVVVSDGGVAWQEVADKCLQAIENRVRLVNEVAGTEFETVAFYVPHDKRTVEKAFGKILGDNPDIHSAIAVGSTEMAEGIAGAMEHERPCAVVFPIAIEPKINDMHPLFCCILPDYDYQAEAMAEYLHKMRRGRLAVIYDKRSSVQTALGLRLAAMYSNLGGRLLNTVPYDQGVETGDEDYSRYLVRANQGGPDIIALLGFSQEVSTMIRQAQELGISARFCGGISWNSNVLYTGSGVNLDRCFYLDFYMDKTDSPAVEGFVSAMEAMGVDYPGLELASGWDAMGLLVEAHKGVDTAEGVHAGLLRAMGSFPQVTGEGTIRERERRVLKRMRVIEIQMEDLSPKVYPIAEIVPNDSGLTLKMLPEAVKQ